MSQWGRFLFINLSFWLAWAPLANAQEPLQVAERIAAVERAPAVPPTLAPTDFSRLGDWVTTFDSRYSDSYTLRQERQNFWKYHKRFGVIRRGNTVILVAKDREIASRILGELRDISSQKTALPKVSTGGIRPGLAYDISKALPPLVAFLHDKYAFDGPNCWNVSLISSRVAFGHYMTKDLEFNHWLQSPLAEEIKSRSDLKAGDLIVMRERYQDGSYHEVHAAVFLTPHLVFTKNGTDEVKPYRLMDLDEMVNIYRFGDMNSMALFRLHSLEKYLATRTDLPRELLKSFDEVRSLEKAQTSLNLIIDAKALDKTPNSTIQRNKIATMERIQKQALSLYKVAEASLEKLKENASRSPITFLWNGIMLRTVSLNPKLEEEPPAKLALTGH